MNEQKSPALIVSVVAIILFMAGVGGLEYLGGKSSNDQKTALLADVSSAASPIAGIPAAASTTIPAAAPKSPAVASALVVPTVSSTTTSSFQKAPSPPVVIPSTTTITNAPKPIALPPTSPSPSSSSISAVTPKVIASSTTTVAGLPYSVGIFGNSFVNGDGWNNLVGTLSRQNGALTVGANASSTAGIAFFGANNNWKNYTFRVNVDWKKGETFSLIAYYVDPKNFLACDFYEPTPGTVHMSFRKHVNGTATSLVTGDVNNYEQMGGDNIDAAIGTQGNQGFCSFNGHKITTYYVSVATSSPKGGGIGFSMWDPKINNSELIVRTVGVTSGLY